MSQITILNHAIFPPFSVAVTLTGNTGGPVGSDAGNNIDIVGANGITVAGNPVDHTLTISGANFISQIDTGTNGPVFPIAGVLSILPGLSGNITTNGILAGTVLVDIVQNPTFTGLVTAENVTVSSLTVAGIVTNSAAGVLGTTTVAALGAVTSFTTNFSGPVFPIAGSVEIIGGASGNITSRGNVAGTVSIDISQSPSFTGLLTTANLTIDALTASGIIQNSAAGVVSSYSATPFSIQIGSATNQLLSLPIGSIGQILQSQGAGFNPSWTTTTYPLTSVTGNLIYASANNIYSNLAIGTAGQVLTVVGGLPVWAASSAAGAVTSFVTNVGGPVVPTGGGVVTVIGGPSGNLSTNGTVANEMTIDISQSPTFTGTVTTAALITASGSLTNYLELISSGIVAAGSNASIPIQLTPKDASVQMNLVATGFTDSAWNFAQNGIETLNATPTVIASLTLATGQMVQMKAFVNGFDEDFSNCIIAEVWVGAYREAAGNILIINAPIVNMSSTSTTMVTATVNTGTQQLNINVIGVAATTYNWVCSYSYFYTITNA